MADPKITGRIPEDLLQLLHDEANRLGVSTSEIIRTALSQYFYGDSLLQGPDAGFASARQLAIRLASAMVAAGAEQMPSNLEEAARWCNDVHMRRQQKA